MSKVCLIYQPCGGGDLLWISKICHYYKDLGYKVIIPVVEEYANFQDYIPWFTFVSWQDKNNKLTHRDKLPGSVNFEYKEKYDPYAPCEFNPDFIYINGFLPPQGRVMEFKFQSAKVSLDKWQDYVIFNRNHNKEKELFYDVLKLTDKSDFVFVNRNYQLRPEVLSYNRISIDPNDYGGQQVVQMEIFDNFSIFDWCLVLERANQLSMIETSINYILEGPEMRNKITDKLFLYSRHNSFHEVSGLFNLPWNYIT